MQSRNHVRSQVSVDFLAIFLTASSSVCLLSETPIPEVFWDIIANFIAQMRPIYTVENER